MSTTLNAADEEGRVRSVELLDLPDECPCCHVKIKANVFTAYFNTRAMGLLNNVEVIFRCPNASCYEVFIGYYKVVINSRYQLVGMQPQMHIGKSFADTVRNISPLFSKFIIKRSKPKMKVSIRYADQAIGSH